MRFFDCCCSIGSPMKGQLLKPTPTRRELLAGMDRSGVDKALVWHLAQRDFSPVDGNRMIADAVRGQKRLFGCWALLPEETGEMPAPDKLIRLMPSAGIRAFLAFPTQHRFVLGDGIETYLEEATRCRIPLLLSMSSGIGWDQVYALLKNFPGLTLIATDLGMWGSDRYFRPMIRKYPNTHIEISSHILDGGIEDFVKRYGPDRMLFGSGFPVYDHGGMMLALKHARIRDKEKEAIASGNLERILGEEVFES